MMRWIVRCLAVLTVTTGTVVLTVAAAAGPSNVAVTTVDVTSLMARQGKDLGAASQATEPATWAQVPESVLRAIEGGPTYAARQASREGGWVPPESNPRVRYCVQRAARAFGVQELPLYLILDVERGSLGQTSKNTNGTEDMGPMQVNTWWLKKLAGAGVTRSEVVSDLCTNIYVGTWIYAQGQSRSETMAEAIALYHSPTPKYQRRYLGRIQAALARRIAYQEAKSKAHDLIAVSK